MITHFAGGTALSYKNNYGLLLKPEVNYYRNENGF